MTTQKIAQQKIEISINRLPIPKFNKPYWLAQLKEFSTHFDASKIKSIHFGREDERSGFSVTLNDRAYCVPAQLLFASRDELMGYVKGFNDARRDYCFPFTDFLEIRS
jgi:hypothetical protein